jgi:threonine dehydrogenase-like Zn-dependent dehydrogenase
MDLLPRIPGSDYLIYGAGTMGLMMAQLARRAGEVSVTIVDTNPDRLVAARDAGFEHVYASANDAAQDKWDVVIDCTGVVPAIEDGLTRVMPGGHFQHFGVAGTDAIARYSPFRVYRDEITIVGTMASLSSFDRAVPLLADGVLNAESMISHYFTLDDYSQAMDMFRLGTGRKLQIRPGASESGVLL